MFYRYVQDYEEDDPKTHKGHDLTRMTMKELYEKFGLEPNTIGSFMWDQAAHDGAHLADCAGFDVCSPQHALVST